MLNKITWSSFLKEIWTMMRYGMVGMANTGLFALLAYLFNRLGWHYAVYTAVSYGIAILFSFTMNTIFTFRKSGKPLGPMFTKFLITTLILLGLVQILQYVLIEKLLWPEFYGVVTGMVFYTGVGYIVNRKWAFK